MSKKISKEELKQPDAFISLTDRVIKWVEKNKNIMMSVFAAFIFIGGGFSLVEYMNDQKNLSAQEELYKVTAQMRSAQKSLVDVKDMKFTPEAFDKNFPGLVAKYEMVISEHEGTSAAVMAGIESASLLSEYKDYARALSVLKKVSSVDTSSVFFGLYYSMLGRMYLSSGNYKGAIDSFKKVIASDKHKFLHSSLVLKTGVAYEAQGELDMARTQYERVVDDFKDSNSAKQAKSYLRLLSLNKSK